MQRLTKFVLNNPVKTLIFITIITVILGSGLFKIQFEASIDSILPKHDKEYILNEKIKKQYGNNGKFIIMCLSGNNVISHDFIKKTDLLHQEIEEYEWYHEMLEEERLSKLNEIEKLLPIDKNKIRDMFSDDLVFQNYLNRRFSEFSPGSQHVTKRKFSKILKRYQTTIEVKKQQLVDIVISPLTVSDLVGKDNTLINYNLIEKNDFDERIIPETEEELALFEKRLRNNPAFQKGIYQADKSGKITDFGVMVRLVDSSIYDPIVDEFFDISSSYNDKNMKTILQGIPVIYRQVNTDMKHDVSILLILVMIVIMIIFYLNFRSIRGIIIPTTCLLLSDIWTLGLMGHLGYKITIVGVALPPLLIAVGSSYSIHILNQYYIDNDLIQKEGLYKGLNSSMRHISLTVLLAGITTFIGFMMLITNEVSSIREMGLFSAIGVIFAVLISTTLIPAALILLPEEKIKISKKNNFSFVDKIVNSFIKLSTEYSIQTIIVLSLILIFSLIGVSRIKVETSFLAYFKQGSYILKTSELIGRKFGGAYGLNIIIDTHQKNGVKDPEFLKFVENFRTWLEADENIDLNIGRTDAFTDFIKTMNLAMHNNQKGYYKIPDKQIDIESYISIYPGRDDSDSGLPDDFDSYVNVDYSQMNLFARMWEKEGILISSSMMDHVINRVDVYLNENLPDGYSHKTSGEPKILVQLADYVVKGQVISLVFSLITVCIIVFLLFRNLKAGLVSAIPISTAVIVNFGLMGWLGFRLDLATALIASITIGIGIDDTIHFLNTYRHFKNDQTSHSDAIRKTLKISGKAIIYTSLALMLGFITLSASNFKPIIYFGILIAGTMISTTIGALLLLPSVINTLKLDLKPSSDNTFWRILNLNKIFKMDD